MSEVPIELHPDWDTLRAQGVMSIFSTFPPSPGLHCEHCPELAAHHLYSPESGDIDLCPKCLRDAMDVIVSLDNFKGDPQL